MSLFKLGTVDLTYVKVKINISIEYYLFLFWSSAQQAVKVAAAQY